MILTVFICHCALLFASELWWCVFLFFFLRLGDHRELHGLTPSFPTRRSSGLRRFASRPAIIDNCRRRDREPWAGGGDGVRIFHAQRQPLRPEEHTSELQSLMRISYAVFCLKKKKNLQISTNHPFQTTSIIHTQIRDHMY